MNRLDQMKEEAAKLYEERFQNTCKGIEEYLKKHWLEMECEMEDILAKLIQEAVCLKESGAKGEATYLIVSHLYSSFAAGTYEYRLDILDEEMYLDEQEVSAYWTPKFLPDHIKADAGYFKEVLQKKFIRLREYEIGEIERDYQFYYHSLIYEIFCCLKKRIEILAGFQVLFGEYMGKAYPVT